MILLLTFTIIFATLFFFAFLINQQVEFCFLILKFIVSIYDLLTLPIYFLVQKPWKNKDKFKTCAKRYYEPNGKYTYWKNENEVKIPEQFKNHENQIDKVKHLSELLPIIRKLNQHNDAIGRRQVLDKLTTENGKTKYVLGDFEWITYEQALDHIDDLTKVLHHKLHLKRGDRVAIMADTQFEWLATFFALQSLGCELVTLHSTLDDEGICYILNLAKPEYIFTQDDLVKTLNRLRPKIEAVSKLITYKNYFVKSLTDVERKEIKYELFNYDDLLKEGKRLPSLNMNNNSEFEPEDIAVLMFTSGSTGQPKGVRLSHTNFIESLKNYLKRIPFALGMKPDDTVIAYLPMSHIFEMMCEVVFFTAGGRLAYGRPGSLSNNAPLLAKDCKGDVQAARVTIWAGVPLVFERVKNQIQTIIKNKSSLVESLYKFIYEYKIKWTGKGYECPLVDRIFFKPIQDQLGGNLRYVVTGGAPLNLDTSIFIKEFFNVKLLLAYASTECSSGCLTTYDNTNHSLSMGIHDIIRMEDWEEAGYYVDGPVSRGELILGGKAVSVGYFENDEETNKAFFEENGIRWWRSGDIGEVDASGNIKIIDRKKDLVKLQMGKYIALGMVEAVFKNCLYVENIVMHGNSFYNYLTAILQPNQDNIIKLAKSIGKDCQDLNELYNDNEVKDALLNELHKYGKANKLSAKELPYAIKICTEEWSPNNGLLTPSLKTRKTQIYSFYKESIDKMYKELDRKFP